MTVQRGRGGRMFVPPSIQGDCFDIILLAIKVLNSVDWRCSSAGACGEGVRASVVGSCSPRFNRISYISLQAQGRLLLTW